MHKQLTRIGPEAVAALARILVIDLRNPIAPTETKSFDQIYPEVLEKFSNLPTKKQKELIKLFRKAI